MKLPKNIAQGDANCKVLSKEMSQMLLRAESGVESFLNEEAPSSHHTCRLQRTSPRALACFFTLRPESPGSCSAADGGRRQPADRRRLGRGARARRRRADVLHLHGGQALAAQESVRDSTGYKHEHARTHTDTHAHTHTHTHTKLTRPGLSPGSA